MIGICYFCLKSGATTEKDLKYLQDGERKLREVNVFNNTHPTYVCDDCMKYAQRASISALRTKDFDKMFSESSDIVPF